MMADDDDFDPRAFAASFVPDDDAPDDLVDESLLAELAEQEASLAAEAEEEEVREWERRGGGVLNAAPHSKRSLDFAAFPAINGAPGTQRLSQGGGGGSQTQTQHHATPLSSLALYSQDGTMDDVSLAGVAAPPSVFTPSAPAPSRGGGAWSNFQRERAEEARRAATAAGAVAPAPLPSAAPAPSVLPSLHRSISEQRSAVLAPPDRLFVFRRAPAAGLSMPFVGPKGDRMYLTMQSEEEAQKQLSAHIALHRSQQVQREVGQTNVRALWAQLNAEAEIARQRAAEVEAAARALESDPEDDERAALVKRRKRRERLQARLDAADEQSRLAARNTQLWVDKYSPRSYADLLSPESINREVLEWLRSWDTCVFGEVRQRDAVQAQQQWTIDAQMMAAGFVSPARKKKVPSVKSSNADGVEEDIRPKHKVILLCGPPGLGKTTLAHILARQAGYHPFEINASDDRSAPVLESKIRAATEMQHVSFGAAHRAKPNCVILDEIDGVASEGGAAGGGQGAIQALLRIIQAEGPKAAKKKGSGGEGENGGSNDSSESEGEDDPNGPPKTRKTRRSKAASGGSAEGEGEGEVGSTTRVTASALPPLRRPIICICNDQFAASLRPLRQIARVFEFTPPPKQKFVERLRFIAAREGLQCDPRTLAALADNVGMDIRAALNLLQFVHSKGARLTATMLNGLALGSKDVERSRFALWEAVFCAKPPKKDPLLHLRDARATERVNNRAMAGSGHGDEQTRELVGLLADAGDIDKIMEGIYHNYPSIGYPDPSFYKTVDCADSLSYGDVLHHRSFSDTESSFNGYLPFVALRIHALTARQRRVALEAPSWLYHQFVSHTRNVQIARSFLSPSCCLTQRGVSLSTTVVDLLPHVLDIVHPSFLRPVGVSLMTSRERAELANLVDTMLSLSLTFRAEHTAPFAQQNVPWHMRAQLQHELAGGLVYKLDPAIDLLSVWTDPTDSSAPRKFDNPRDRFGNQLSAGAAAAAAAQAQAPGAASLVKADRREQHMPPKMKQMLQREIEFEAMRRSEQRRAEAAASAGATAAAAQAAATSGAADAGLPPASPQSMLSPAVQRLLAEEQRKRDRASAAAASSSLSSPSSRAAGAAPAVEDESPATKRAKLGSSLNFLAAHADHLKRGAQRRAQGAKAKVGLKLEGMKSEREQKAANASANAATEAAASAASDDASTSMDVDSAATSAHPVVSSVLSRFTHSLHFKYNDGCTNAVRRTIPLSHFLPL